MKTQIKYAFFLCIIFMPKIAYMMEQGDQILSLMCKPLTDYIPCEKITEDDYIEHILRQIGGLQKWPNANKMAELIETFEDVQKNMPDISCKALGQLIFTKKSQSPVSILASLVADQMNDY